MSTPTRTSSWLEQLADEDVTFIKRFVLASGSLKAIAKAYDISYPTVRLRLDRLIEKVKVLDDQQISSAFERRLRSLYADGRIDMPTVKTLLGEHQREMEGSS